MASSREEMVLDVPVEWIKNSQGFAMDFGGSVINIVYRSHEDWTQIEHADIKACTTGRLRLVSFAREEMAEAIQYLKDRCSIASSPDAPVKVFSTGCGCNQYGPEIGEQLNVKLCNLSEFDCFVKAFSCLIKRLPREEILEEPDAAMKELIENRERQMAQLVKVVQGALEMGATKVGWHVSGGELDKLRQKFSTESQGHTEAKSTEHEEQGQGHAEVKATEHQGQGHQASAAEPSLFPCLLATLGSGFGTTKVNEDGSFSFTEGSNRGGRMFLGLGQLLTGAKDYGELIELAAKGESWRVDTYTHDMAKREGDLYAAHRDMDSRLIWCFGKAVGHQLDDFKREDLASALLTSVALDVVNLVHQSAMVDGLSDIYLGGSFTNTYLVRSRIAEEFTTKKLYGMVMRGPERGCVNLHFLKHGAYLGALGALIHHSEPFLESAGS